MKFPDLNKRSQDELPLYLYLSLKAFFLVLLCARCPSHPGSGRHRKGGEGVGERGRWGGTSILLPASYDWLKRDTYPTAPRPMGKRLRHRVPFWLVRERLLPSLVSTNGMAALAVTSEFFFFFLFFNGLLCKHSYCQLHLPDPELRVKMLSKKEGFHCNCKVIFSSK